MKNMRVAYLAILWTAFALLQVPSLIAESGVNPEAPIRSLSQSRNSKSEEVTVTVGFLNRPGEFSLEIRYYGVLLQEGAVNCFLDVNGTSREFVCLAQEQEDGSRRVKILSFHPVVRGEDQGPNRLRAIQVGELVDYLLFRTAPYYPQLGKVKVTVRFFSNGRYGNDGNKIGGAYHFEFESPVSEAPLDHSFISSPGHSN